MKSFFILAAMVLPAFAQFGISVAAPKESARVTISQPLLVEVDKEVTAIPHHDLALTINITSQVNGFEYTFFSGRYEFNEPPAGSNRKPSVDILGQLPTNFPAGNATVSVFNHYVVGDNPEGQTEFITVPVVAVN